jgi:hypothetical protein
MAGAFSMVCLAVLLNAPQFVAFDRTAPMGTGALARPSRAQLGNSLGPQQLRISDNERSPVGTTARETTAKAVRPRAVAGRQLAPISVVAARLHAPPRERVVEASAGADREVVPEFRTLVFIEATQYGTADSPVWRVQVWRVMLLNTVRERVARLPVAHST